MLTSTKANHGSLRNIRDQRQDRTNQLTRTSWTEGSKVEVYSASAQIWYDGDIIRIFFDNEGEWLEVQYTVNSTMRLKQIPRFDENAIRPTKNTSKPISNTNQPSSTIKSNTNINVDEMSKEAIDHQIRQSWVRGSRVEVYSRSKKKWCKGIITRIFTDAEGEWMEVRYGKNLVKETPRDSIDIRPLRVRYKNRFKWTREHESRVTAIWEDIDLENTRHLDILLVSAVFRALNIILDDEEMKNVFRWIDREERDAITLDEFVRWMTDSVETMKQRQIQQLMYDAINATVTGKLDISNLLKEEEKIKLKAIYAQQYGKHINVSSSNSTLSRFNPSIDKPMMNSNRTVSKIFNHSQFEEVDDEKIHVNTVHMQPSSMISIDDDECIECESDILYDMEFSEEEDEINVDDDEKIPRNTSIALHAKVMSELNNKLKDVGFTPEFLIASVASQQEEYHSSLSQRELRIRNNNMVNSLKDIQDYMIARVRKSGIEGLRTQELNKTLIHKYPNFNQTNYLPLANASFADFVSLTPGLVIVEMESCSREMEDIAVTNEAALKINLKTKLEFVLTMLFDKGKITNTLQPILSKGKDRYGRNKTRKLSVAERLITVNDFVDRIRSLGVEMTQMEGDELFWAVAGSNSTMISQKMVARYFSSLVEQLPDPVHPEVADALPRVIALARLRYRREPLWSKYIIKRTISRWNNIHYLRLTDRRTRTKLYDMIATPKTRSVHGGELYHVQSSFHHTCHILNKLQYPTVAKKVDHGSDKFNFCCVTQTPHLRSFPAMLDEAKQREIPYSEHFIAQVIGIICETVLFCHKYNTVNMNLNIDSLGFDAQLRPILLDFSRSIVIAEDQKTSRFSSVMSSTPPELALLMGCDNPLMNIELNGNVLRKADAWRVGVLLYVLTTGRLPFHSTSLGNFITHVLTRPPVVSFREIECSKQLKHLLSRLLETTYFNRLEIADALKDPWFKSASKQPLSSDIINNIRNVCKLENARNWISTITHAGTDYDSKKVDRDRKYFARLDPTGQRKSLKKEMLEEFMQARLGYCYYRAKQIISVFIKKMNERALQMSGGHTYEYDIHRSFTWKEFLPLYEARHFVSPGNSRQSSMDTRDVCGDDRHVFGYVSGDANGITRQFTNAIFAGLDPEGLGFVSCKLLMMLFEDINLKLVRVVDRLSFQIQMSFEECVGELIQAFQNGFDIQDLLSVDHIVNSM